MMPAKRMTHTGTIKDENGAIILDTGSYKLVINMNGFNPEADRQALLPFVGKRVAVTGIIPPGGEDILVNGLSDISPVNVRKHSQRPPGQ